jgi:hypothetical protein
MPTLEETLNRVLALPREAGTPDAAIARDLVAEYLEALGYRVERQRFAFTPSALNGFPLFGAGLGGLGLLLLPLLSTDSAPGWAAAVLLTGGLALLLVIGFGVGAGWLPVGGERREDANLIATRGDAPARRWIVAHLDTKAQMQSMAGRLVAVWMIGVAVAVLAALAVVRTDGALPLPLAGAGVLLTIAAGGLAGRGRLRGVTPGARDNGSGVAGALAAARVRARDTAILITGAEEFGMVGARVFVAQAGARLDSAEVINLDTIDQEGELALVSHDARGDGLAQRLGVDLAATGLAPRRRRLPMGILTDSLPFARAGVPAVTIGRLTWRTLRTIHTSRDIAEGLSLETAARVGSAVASSN